MANGFLHTKMDVKVLVLFVLSRIKTPLDTSSIYEICYQDESLNYFTLSECLAELADSGHITIDQNNQYLITDKGVKQGAVVEDSLALPVVRRVTEAVEQKKNELIRASNITSEYYLDSTSNWVVKLTYRNQGIPLMTVCLHAPDEKIAQGMADNMLKNISDVYKACMEAALDANRKSICNR